MRLAVRSSARTVRWVDVRSAAPRAVDWVPAARRNAPHEFQLAMIWAEIALRFDSHWPTVRI